MRRGTHTMLKTGAAVLVAAALFLAFLYMNNDIGISRSRLETDIRTAQKISEDWAVAGTVSDTMAAFISYPADQSEHTFSVYVNRPGLSFGYFFRSGGSMSDLETGIARFTLDGYREMGFISMNQQKIARVEIDDGNSVEVMEIDSTQPFALVLPANSGSITFYDTQGNQADTWEKPM